MRVSTHQYHLNTLRNIQHGAEQFNEYSVQLATNKRIARPSDDPLGTVMLLTLDSELKALDQYKNNMESVHFTLGQQETQLSSIVTQLFSLQELMTTAADGSMGEAELAALGQEMAVLFPGIVDLLNATDGNGRYFFSGSLTDTKPFEVNGAGQYQYNGDDNVRKVAVSADSQVDANIVGSNLAPNADFLNDMQDYLALIAAPPAAGVGNESRAMLGSISDFLATVTGEVTRIGGVRASLDSIVMGNEDITLFTQGLRDDISEVDYPSTYVKMNEAMASYESTLKVYSSVSKLSLFSMF